MASAASRWPSASSARARAEDARSSKVSAPSAWACFTAAAKLAPAAARSPLAALLKRGHLAGVGLDVLPVEPPVEPIPELLRAYRAREPWCEGRLIITPHSAFFTPEAWDDIRLKSAETMRAAMVGPRPQNVITPDMF